MAEIKINTANIPKYVADALCADLLKAIREYIRNNPGGAEELAERGRAYRKNIAAQEAEKNKMCEV